MKKNKLFTILILVIAICLIFTGIVCAIKVITKNKGKLVATYNSSMYADTNTVWVGSFQLAWNEFMKNIVDGEVEFENEKNALLEELNRGTFNQSMINENDYYIKVGKTSPELKSEILNNIERKFAINNQTILDNINFENKENSYTIYSILNKKFEFLSPFNTMGETTFKDSKDKFEYFGIKAGNGEILSNNINSLFYNNSEDFAISLNTKENEEVILYRTNDNDTFENTYEKLKDKFKEYGNKEKFTEMDELKIPTINMDILISYDELCNKYIKGTNAMYISNALQNVKFNLDKFGGILKSESYIEEVTYSDRMGKGRNFYFTDRFIVFLKEKDKNMPYMALLVDNSEILKKCEQK